MNEVINAILTRISVRKFTDQRIEDEKLKLIADCAKAAPTGKNRFTQSGRLRYNFGTGSLYKQPRAYPRRNDTGFCAEAQYNCRF